MHSEQTRPEPYRILQILHVQKSALPHPQKELVRAHAYSGHTINSETFLQFCNPHRPPPLLPHPYTVSLPRVSLPCSYSSAV